MTTTTTPSIDLIFEEPAAKSIGADSGKWEVALVPLMSHPGTWIRIGAFNSGMSSMFNKRQVRMPAGRWEFVGRRKNAVGQPAPATKVWLYGRYLGPDED